MDVSFTAGELYSAVDNPNLAQSQRIQMTIMKELFITDHLREDRDPDLSDFVPDISGRRTTPLTNRVTKESETPPITNVASAITRS